MGIMTSSHDVTAHDNNGVEIPTKNTYPYSYSSLHDTLPHQSQTCPQVFRKFFSNETVLPLNNPVRLNNRRTRVHN